MSRSRITIELLRQNRLPTHRRPPTPGEIIREEFPMLEVKQAERDRLMPRRGTLCVDRAREIIGYDPRWPIDLGMPEYMDWYRRVTSEPAVAYGRRSTDR